MFKYKVMLVDDEPIILDGLTEIFLNEFDNIEIVGKYKDGIAAIEHLKKQTADFVITDINMPKANGLDILKYIRESKLETKCVLITGYEQFEYAVQAIDYGADALLQKPINLKKLISVINSLFEKNSSHINSIMEKTQYYLDRRNLSRDSLLLYSNNHISFGELCERLSRNNENKLNYIEAQCLYLKFSWEER